MNAAVDPEHIQESETALIAYATEIDDWLIKVNEPAMTDGACRAADRAGLSAKVAAFYHAVGLSGLADAPMEFEGKPCPIREWRVTVNAELPTSEPEITDAEMMDWAGEGGANLSGNLAPLTNPAAAAAGVLAHRAKVIEAATPAGLWRATAVLPTGAMSEEKPSWAEGMNWLRAMWEAAQPEGHYTEGVLAMQQAEIGKPWAFKAGRCEMQLAAPKQASAEVVTGHQEITPQPAADSLKQPEAATKEDHQPAGSDPQQSPDEVATWHVTFTIAARHADAKAFADRIGAAEKMQGTVSKADAKWTPKPPRPPTDVDEIILNELATPEGITSQRIKELLGWNTDPALSHVKARAKKVGREADVEDMGGVRAEKRFRFKVP